MACASLTVCDPSSLAQICGNKVGAAPIRIALISERFDVYDRLNERARSVRHTYVRHVTPRRVTRRTKSFFRPVTYSLADVII
jgi:hypothetical protein